MSSYTVKAQDCEMVTEICVSMQGPRYWHQRAAVQGHTHYCMTSLNFWVNSETEYSGGLRKACPAVRHDIGPLRGLGQRPTTHLRFKYPAWSKSLGISLMDMSAPTRDAAWNVSTRSRETHSANSQWQTGRQGISTNSLDFFFFFASLGVMVIWSSVKGKGEYGVQTKGVWIN